LRAVCAAPGSGSSLAAPLALGAQDWFHQSQHSLRMSRPGQGASGLVTGKRIACSSALIESKHPHNAAVTHAETVQESRLMRVSSILCALVEPYHFLTTGNQRILGRISKPRLTP